MNAILRRRAPCWLLLLGACGSASAFAQAAPNWYTSVEALTQLFKFEDSLKSMGQDLEYFRVVFTALGCGAVMVTAIRNVSKARGGEESLGWVASMVMTIALMATATQIGGTVYKTCDDVAKKSAYTNEAAIKTCWNSLLVILPGDSPSQEVLQEAKPSTPPAAAPTQKQDASWTKLAWTWMKMAWSTMSDALGQIGVALKSVAVRFVVLLLLFFPAVALITGMLLIQIGGFVREFLHQTMDVFLPMMIGMLSFAPMRGAATNYIVKYLSVAFWPIAWALGNAVACSLLLSVMRWVVGHCETVLDAANQARASLPPEVGPAAAGYLVGAAALMPWGFLFLIIIVITVTSLLIHVSAIGAPAALTSMMTRGTCFATAQLKQAAAAAATFASTAVTGGASLAAAPALGASLLSATTTTMSAVASRASASMGSAASRLAPAAAAGGPLGMLASVGSSALGRASGAIASLAGGGSMEFSGSPSAPMPKALPAPAASMMDAGQWSQPGAPSEATRPQGSSAALAPMFPARAVSRNFRRSLPVIDV